MARFKLTIEYDGRPFCGWQRQADHPSVQEEIEKAILSFSGEAALIGGAGRTDAGVHATGQVAHVDLNGSWDANRVREALNFHLKPNPIAILSVEEVSEEFDARFSAAARHYHYRIINRRPPLTFDRGQAMHVKHDLDAALMHEAAQCLVGTHDYTTFRHVHCQAKSPVKSIDHINVERNGDEISIFVSARSFLHNQVRSIAGSLVQVGGDRWTVTDFKNALEACDRSRCGPVAPAEGLCLYQVDY